MRVEIENQAIINGWALQKEVVEVVEIDFFDIASGLST